MNSEHDPDGYRMPTPMALVDITASARRMYGPEKTALMYPRMPESDWRFIGLLPSGAHVTFGRDCTAQEIAEYLRREGVDMDSITEPGTEEVA